MSGVLINSNNYDTSRKDFIERFIETGKISIYIDDLDRGWQGKREDITQISSLLNSVRDISRDNRGVIFKVSLRADVYYLVRTSDQYSGQFFERFCKAFRACSSRIEPFYQS